MATETTYLAGRGLEVLLASLVALVATSHGDDRLIDFGEKRKEENEKVNDLGSRVRVVCRVRTVHA